MRGEKVIIFGGWADGVRRPSDPPVDRPAYLSSYNVDVDPGLGSFEFSLDPADALHFPDSKTAMDVWQKQSEKYPLRDWDHKPNRPLTAFNAIVEDAP